MPDFTQTEIAATPRAAGQILLELNNIVNEQYTGIFSVQLSATFYAATPAFPAARKADLILPLTTGKRRSSQMLSYPGDTRRALEPPMNTAEAYLEILATGAAEEASLAW